MPTIIICDGLIRETVSPEPRYLSSLSNIGKPEISRLMGGGRQIGQGPLPRFLSLAVELSAIDKSRIKLLFICDISPILADDDLPPVEGNPKNPVELAEPFDEISNHATIIPTTKGVVPWQSIIEEIGEDGVADMSDHRFLIVGCQTEERILGISILLHNMLGYNEVAVCPHLVGSKTQEGHLAALRHNLPAATVGLLSPSCTTCSRPGRVNEAPRLCTSRRRWLGG